MCSVKKLFLETSQNSQENTCAREACNFIKKESLTQVFSCEFCEISKKTFFTEYLRWLLLHIVTGIMVINQENSPVPNLKKK